MKCKKHLGDLSSTLGVCASCLRDRLFILIASQAQAEIDGRDDCQGFTPDPLPPAPHPPRFPPSVSPPVGRHRKSSSSSYDYPVQRPHRHRCRFFSTPQVGPFFSSNPNPAVHEPSAFLPEKKPSRFSLLSLFLRKGSEKFAGPNPTSHPASSSSSSSIFGLWKKKPQSSPFTGSTMSGSAHMRKCSAVVSNRGMSPAGGGSDEDEDLSPSNSGYSSEDCPHSWRRTPASSAAFVTPRRVTTTPHHPRNRSGFAFCLSPLVRTNTGGNWKNKGGMLPGETAYSGNLVDAAPLCKNRSRKLADFGRGEYWR